jgi:hypothetical protein
MDSWLDRFGRRSLPGPSSALSSGTTTPTVSQYPSWQADNKQDPYAHPAQHAGYYGYPSHGGQGEYAYEKGREGPGMGR